MRRLLASNRLAVAVWAGLVVVTLVSWQLGIGEGGSSGTGVSVATMAVIVLAFVKVRFVGRHFMEMRNAPLVMRLVLDVYVAVVCIALLVIYAVTS